MIFLWVCECWKYLENYWAACTASLVTFGFIIVLMSQSELSSVSKRSSEFFLYLFSEIHAKVLAESVLLHLGVRFSLACVQEFSFLLGFFCKMQRVAFEPKVVIFLYVFLSRNVKTFFEMLALDWNVFSSSSFLLWSCSEICTCFCFWLWSGVPFYVFELGLAISMLRWCMYLYLYYPEKTISKLLHLWTDPARLLFWLMLLLAERH